MSNPTCARCGVGFVPCGRNKPNQKYCGQSCRDAAAFEVRKARGDQPPIRNCRNCGKAFQPYGSQRFCSTDCRVSTQAAATVATTRDSESEDARKRRLQRTTAHFLRLLHEEALVAIREGLGT